MAAGPARPGRRRGLLAAVGSGSPAFVAAAFQVGARAEVHRCASRPTGPSPPLAWSCAPLRA
eukprot:11068241-Alexandrium_andersonii.AAC.1